MERDSDIAFRHFRWTYFGSTSLKGWTLILEHYKRSIRWCFDRIRSLWGEDVIAEASFKGEQDDIDTPLTYGFLVLSKICTTHCSWIPFFIYDIKLGLYPTKVFATFSYCTVILGMLLASLVSHQILTSLVDGVLPNIKIIRLGVIFTEIAYGTMGLTALARMVYKRRAIQDFILFKCSNIKLPKSYQKKMMVRAYNIISLLALFSEPTFAFLTVYQEFNQPFHCSHCLFRSLNNLNKTTFALLRYISLFVVLGGGTILSISESLIPMMTCFIDCALAKHLKCVSKRQISRLHRFRPQVVNQRMPNIKSTSSARIISDYSATTILMDWPEIDNNSNLQQQQASKQELKLYKSKRYSMEVSGRLFLYKNIIHTLMNLKDVIAEYEGIFGYYHAILIHIQIIRVGQWIVLGIQQYRDRSGMAEQEVSSDIINPFVLRTCLSAFNFIMTNIFVFFHCDKLRLTLDKLQNQLYKINLELEGNFQDEQATTFETNLVWSSYDSLKRISNKAKLRLLGNTYYGKHCLLFIFTRTISLVMLYLQVIDVAVVIG